MKFNCNLHLFYSNLGTLLIYHLPNRRLIFYFVMNRAEIYTRQITDNHSTNICYWNDKSIIYTPPLQKKKNYWHIYRFIGIQTCIFRPNSSKFICFKKKYILSILVENLYEANNKRLSLRVCVRRHTCRLYRCKTSNKYRLTPFSW